jgi:hypothetical protein
MLVISSMKHITVVAGRWRSGCTPWAVVPPRGRTHYHIEVHPRAIDGEQLIDLVSWLKEFSVRIAYIINNNSD